MPDTDKPVLYVPGARILISRHGATVLNAAKGTKGDVVRGQMDPPLTPEGEREAKRLGGDLRHAQIRELYCSTLQRASDTAKAIGKPYHLSPRRVRELLPWDMGDIQGAPARLAKPVLRSFAERHPTQRIPHGESFAQWRQRFLDWMRKLVRHVEAKECCVCCVSHSRCLKLLQGWVAAGMKGDRIDFDVMFTDNTEPGEVYDFRPDRDGKWAIHIAERGFMQTKEAGGSMPG